MPRLTAATPKYRHHRASGQAVVTIAGKDHYLGPWKSKASKVEYDRLIGEWLAAGRPSPPSASHIRSRSWRSRPLSGVLPRRTTGRTAARPVRRRTTSRSCRS